MVRGLEERLWIERANAVWAVAKSWSAGWLAHRRWSPAGGCNWVWVLVVAYGEQWTCCWNE